MINEVNTMNFIRLRIKHKLLMLFETYRITEDNSYQKTEHKVYLILFHKFPNYMYSSNIHKLFIKYKILSQHI